MKYVFFFSFLLFSCIPSLRAQAVKSNPIIINTDSTTLKVNPAFSDSSASKNKKAFSPQKATLRSAILPGWGQAYTKRYLMIPVVYAGLGVPAGFFIYNNVWYKRSRFAYELKVEKDTSRFGEIDRKLVDLSPESLRFYRNDFRKNRDYSVLFFILAWGLNVVDATVFAHLKQFDVSDDLSMKIKPNLDLRSSGISIVLAPRDATRRRLLTAR